MTLAMDILKRNRLLQWGRTQFFPEFKALMKLAWPIILMNMFRFFNPTISVIMCGHLTKVDFDASSLANAIINVFGVSIDLGFSTACDTLFSQVYGSRNKRRLGLMLQRAMLVMTIVYLILACLHLNIEPIFILLKQDVEISRLATRYITFFLPGLFFDFQFLAISRYLQSQNIVYPMMIAAGVGCVFNAVAQYIAIYVLNFGIEASAIIQGSSCFVTLALQLSYVLISKIYVPTWQGFECWNALEEWGMFFKLGIPGIIMLGVEELAFQIMLFVSGDLSDVQLGAVTIIFQVASITYMIHVGLAISVAIRAGQHLGGDKPKEASLTAKSVLITDVMISLCNFCVVVGFRNYIPYIFTNDKEIRSFAAEVMILLASIQLIDGTLSSACGIFRACGKQKIAAIIMLLSYYLIGIPLGFVLVYVVKTDIRGFFWALILSMVVEIFFYLVVVYRINWNQEALKAAGRVKESRLSQCEDEDGSEQISENIKLLKSGRDNTNENIVNPAIVFRGTNYRRPSSNVTDILISTMKDAPKVSQYNRLNKYTVIKRSIFLSLSLLLFLLSILCKIYLPRGYFIPCIPVGNITSSMRLDKHYPLCNDTIYDI